MLSRTKNNFSIPAFIIILGLIIAGGIILYRTQTNTTPSATETTQEELSLRPITDEDKILGNPNADLIIVEYSDFECLYCKDFHQTMESIMIEYGRSGKVAWVFRHFPIEKIHKNAKNAAIASECVFKIAGNEKFWSYSNILFSSSTEILSLENLTKMATELEISEEQFSSCLKNTEIISKIESDIKEGMLIYENDARFGTPYSFLITKSGIQTRIIGSQPYSTLKKLIEQFITLSE
jgi:protein-disulfide isomerase